MSEKISLDSSDFKYISCYFYRFFCNLPPSSIIFRCMERTRYVIRLLLM